MKKVVSMLMAMLIIFTLCACDSAMAGGSAQDTSNTKAAANTIQGNQPTPTDLDYSLERYNLIRRAYWVNGQQAKADAIICEVEKPLGYIALYAGSTYAGSYIVDGKVSSLNSYLTPDSEYYEVSTGGNSSTKYNLWLADVDGSYGQNDNGIFFFTVDGHYHEWTGLYHYSDVPIIVDTPTASYEVIAK
jgi:hypothetical protein